VSLLLRDQLRIDLRPDRVVLVRQRGWPRKTVVARQIEICGAPLAGEALWEPVLRAMHAGAAAIGNGRLDATVVLSHHFVRYALIPRGAQLSNDREEQAYLRYCFSKTYGGDAEHWALRQSASGRGEILVASAIDQRLLDGLDRVATACSWRLTSVQPSLMTVFNHWRRRLHGAALWFISVEPGRLCIVRVNHGQWSSLRTIKIDDGWLTRLPQLLDRELQLSGCDTPRGSVFISAPDVSHAAVLPASDWEIHWLEISPDPGVAPGRRLAEVLLVSG